MVQQDVDTPDTTEAADLWLKYGPGAKNMRLGFVDYDRKPSRRLEDPINVTEP